MLKTLIKVRNAYRASGLSFNAFFTRNNKLFHELDPFVEAHKDLFGTPSEVLHWINGDRKLKRCYVCGKRVSYKASKNEESTCSKECRFSPIGKEHKARVMFERHGFINPSQKEETKRKVKETVRKKYGVDNVAAAPEIQQKMKNTSKERYGVENVFALDSVKEKIRQTNLERYGAESYNQSEEGKARALKTSHINAYNRIVKRLKDSDIEPLFTESEYTNVEDNHKFRCKICGTEFFSNLDDGRFPKCPKCTDRYRSSGEIEICDFISNLREVSIGDRTALKGFKNRELDIYCPNEKVAFEYDGLYYHGSQFKDKNYHLQKTKDCAERGIQLIHIFEDEWIYKKQIVKARIKAILGRTPYRIQARKCEVRVVDSKLSMKFLDKYHLQGAIGAKVNLGLFYRNRLVALMTFGKPRFNKDVDWELLRYCTLSNFNIVGGASKLYSHFRDVYEGKVLTYADRRWSNGNLYVNLGFKLSHESAPAYFYAKNDQRFNRVSFQKHKLKDKLKDFDPNLSEWENMKNNKYDKIYDCGNLVFVSE